MKWLFLGLILLITSGVLLGVTVAARQILNRSGAKSWLGFAGVVCLGAGVLGFFGNMISALGGMDWLPPRFEWPVGLAVGAVRDSGGNYVVPHTPSGRIQLYDADLRFVRGWSVDAHGGTFVVQGSVRSGIDVYTARGRQHFRYDGMGRLLSAESYAPRSFGEFAKGPSESFFVPTFPLLWPFAHPFAAVATAFLGGGLLAWSERSRKKRRQGHRST